MSTEVDGNNKEAGSGDIETSGWTVHEDTAPSGPESTPRKDLEAALNLLRKRDDTSRFVGLALLKPVLEQELSDGGTAIEEKKYAIVQRCWDAIPIVFIDRLLKARTNDKRSKDEVENMVGLAVAVLYAFMTLLDSPEKEEKVMGRVPLLRTILRSCPQATRTQIMNIFHILAMTREGSSAIFGLNIIAEKSDQKPESYLFVTMLLIDIRSTIPSLLEKLHTEEYSVICERLCKAYDLTSAFIGFLIQSLETMSTGETPSIPAPMPGDLLLKIRTNISETLFLTIEHVRDRYDSSTAGAAGLHPSARTSASAPLPIAWDTSSGMFNDALTLSQLRTLSLWLRDEENDALRREAAGIMDVLIALYQHQNDQDFRSPVLVALEGIIETPEGIEAFLHEGGWETLFKDLSTILSSQSSQALGIEIVRVLLTVAESDVAGPAKEDWVSTAVTLTQKYLIRSTPAPALELPIAVAQLATELLHRAPRGVQKRYSSAMRDVRSAISDWLENRIDVLNDDDREGLEEVFQGLQLE